MDASSIEVNRRDRRSKTDKLDVPKGATASLVGFMVNANAIARTTLTGMYGRKK